MITRVARRIRHVDVAWLYSACDVISGLSVSSPALTRTCQASTAAPATAGFSAPSTSGQSAGNRSRFASIAAAATAATVASTCCAIVASDAQDPAKGAEQLVRSLWGEVVDDIQRADAKLPSDVQVTELHPPVVTQDTGWSVNVRIPVREGVDLKSVEQALLDLRFSARPTRNGKGPTRSFFSSSSISWKTDRQGKTMVINQKESAREIRFTIPSAYSRQVPCVELHKQGSLEQEDLTLCAQIMTHANNLAARSPPMQPGFGQHEGLFGEGWREKDPFAGSLFSGLDGFARQMKEFEDLANAMADLVEDQARRHQWGGFGEDGAEDDDASRASPPTLPDQPRFREHRRGEPGEQGARGRPGPADPARAQLERQARELEKLGARVYLPEENEDLDWSLMAGYSEQKALIEDILLIGLKNPDVYKDMAARTRKDKKAQRPKAVLFAGPPGTGKTTSARIIAKQAAVPLVYIPLEAVASKWYGESEQKLSQMLNAAEAMGGCIIFLDEVDSLATSRGDNMYEATRRLLGVLLRFIDGFEATQSIVVAATNRQQDLDAALISRFDSIITFGLPDLETRSGILKHYAAHLTDEELQAIAQSTPGMSARDLRAICEVTERRWASAIVKGQQPAGSLPKLDSYMMAAQARMLSLGSGGRDRASLLADLGQRLASEDKV